MARPAHKDTIVLDGIRIKVNSKSPNKFYTCVITATNGQKFSRGLGTSNKTLSIEKALVLKAQINADINQKDGLKSMSLTGVYKSYLKSIADKKPSFKVNARNAYNRLLGQRIHSHTGELIHYELGDVDKIMPVLYSDESKFIHKLTVEEFDRWFSSIRGVLSDGTVARLVSTIATMFEHAASIGVQTPDINFRSKHEFLETDVQKTRDIHEDELTLILNHFRASKWQHNYYRLQVALYTGLRLGEIATLKRSHVDFNNRTIKVTRQKQKIAKLSTLPMSAALADELGVWIEHTKHIDSEWLFCDENGRRFATQSQWFTDALKILDINQDGQERLTLHSLRARFITRQLQADISPAKIQLSVDHANLATTMVYSRLSVDDASKTASELMSKLERDRTALAAEMQAKRDALDAEYAKAKAEIEKQFSDLDNI